MAKVFSANFWLIETFSNNLKHIQSMNPWVQPGNMGNISDISSAWLVATCIISQRHLEHSVSCKSAISKVKIIQSNWVQPNWGRSCLNMFYYVLKKEKLEVLDKIHLWLQDVPHILSIENIKRKVGRTHGPHHRVPMCLLFASDVLDLPVQHCRIRININSNNKPVWGFQQ